MYCKTRAPINHKKTNNPQSCYYSITENKYRYNIDKRNIVSSVKIVSYLQ